MASAKISKRLVDQVILQAVQCGKTQYCRDTELKGFGVLATAKGSASYFIEYRLGGRSGRNRRVSFGKHGPFTPDSARKKALQLKADLTQNIDVAEVRMAERRRLVAATFGDAVETYMQRHMASNRTRQEARRLLEYDAVPWFGNKPIAGIARGDVAALIDIVAVRSESVARALFAALRPFFRWATERELIDQNPMANLKPPTPHRPRDRVLNDNEVRLFWEATFMLSYPFGPLFQLLLLTGQRRAEVAGMSWSELDYSSKTWTLASERTKNGKPHIVDMAPSALSCIDALPRRFEMLFSTNGRTPPSGFSKAKRQLDGLMAENSGESIEPWRLHDLRRTAATGMAGLGFPPHVVERVINHTSGARGGIVSVYQHHEYRPERRDALLRWGEQVQLIVNMTEPTTNIIPIASRLGAAR